MVDRLLHHLGVLAPDGRYLGPGTRLGPFRLLRRLPRGRGGTAVVFRAEAAGVPAPVALKIALAGSEAEACLIDESQSLLHLNHPGVVGIGQVPTARGGRQYLGTAAGFTFVALELLRGEALDQRLSWGEQLGWDEILSLLGRVGDALDYCHRMGVVHCDVKPRNIVYREARGRPERRAVLIDFGIARSAYRPGAVRAAGTRPYMAPEQHRLAGGFPTEVTPQTDLWSLAVVAYELLTGARPRSTAGGGGIDLSGWAAGWGRLRAGDHVRDALHGVFGRAFATAPGRRHASCRALIADLRGALILDGPARMVARRPRNVARGAVCTLAWTVRTAASDALAGIVAGVRSARGEGDADRRGSARRERGHSSQWPDDHPDATPLLPPAGIADTGQGKDGPAESVSRIT